MNGENEQVPETEGHNVDPQEIGNKGKLSNLKEGLSALNGYRKDAKEAGGIGNLAKKMAADKLSGKINAGKDALKSKINDKLPDSVKQKKDALKTKTDAARNKVNNVKNAPDLLKQKLNEKAFKTGVKAAADIAAPGTGEIAEKLLDTPLGEKPMEAARNAANPLAAIKDGTKKLLEIVVKQEVKKSLIKYLGPAVGVFCLIGVIFLAIFGAKFSDATTYADNNGDTAELDKNYQKFYKNVNKVGSSENNKYMIIAALTVNKENDFYACSDEDIKNGLCEPLDSDDDNDDSETSDKIEELSPSKIKSYMKKINKKIEQDGGNLAEGDYDDPENTGSKLFQWYYTEFVEKYYEEYFTGLKDQDSIIEKKKDIIQDIYIFYNDLISGICSDASSSTKYDSACDFNATKVDVLQCGTKTVMTTIPLKDYILGVVYGEINDMANDENTFKMMAIVARTYSLARAGYNSNTKHIKLQGCTRDQVWCDIYNGCNYYKDSGGFDALYSKSYTGLSGGRNYNAPLSKDRLEKWNKWYDETQQYLILDLSKHQGPITSLGGSDVLGYFDKEQDFWYSQSTKNHRTFQQMIKDTAQNCPSQTNCPYYQNKDLYDLGSYCKAVSSGGTSVAGQYIYYSQSLEPWASMTHGCGSGKSFAAKGCFQTSAAMILSNLLGREITPKDTNNYTNNNRSKSCYGTTSYYTFFENVASAYGVNVKSISNKTSTSAKSMLDELAKGNLITQILDCQRVSPICPKAFGGHGIAIVPGSKSGYVRVLDSAYPNEKSWEVTAEEATGSNTQGSFYVWSLGSGTVSSGQIDPNNPNLVTGGTRENVCASSSNSSSQKYDKTIYVGDSRTVGMKDAVNNSSNEEYIAEIGMGYSWFKNTAQNEIKSKLDSNANQNVIINMGTNDLTSSNIASSYVALYKSLSNTYKDSNFIILSVTPIEDSKNSAYTSINNNLVIDFNKKLKEELDKNSSNSRLKYCNIYEKLEKNGYSTTDGIHYDNDTYKKIYQYIKEC